MTHLLVALVLSGITVQVSPASLAGTWVAELNGVTFVRLELKGVNGQLTGAIGTGNIHVTGEYTAELTFLPSEEDLEELKEAGIPPPKPIALRKVR